MIRRLAERTHWEEARWPRAADVAAAERLLDAFGARYGEVDPALTPLLCCLGGNSSYLADLALREGEQLQAMLADGPTKICERAVRQLTAASPALARGEVARLARQAKRQVALAAAIADIGGFWTLESVTEALSRLADAALGLCVRHLLWVAHGRGELRLGGGGRSARSGFVALAMGKLGARALNYSSDVDLILLFDPGAHPYNADGLGAILTRLARDLTSLMQTRDADGYVFRLDYRLRPDPGSTPPALALPAALAYYEGQAQTWERAAMIKARPVAGDLALGARFLEAIRPFVWRRHLDFAAIADIRAMKLRMDAHHDAALEGLAGHDVKLGQGGIREVEFCAQTLQLVWGGRNAALRVPGTLDALHALAAAGHLPAATVERLEAAYRFLRQVEHRLQMVADRQTHSLPTGAAFEGFAVFAGFADGEAFAAAMLPHLSAVHETFRGILSVDPMPPDLPAERTLRAKAPAGASGAEPPWFAWLEGRPRALRSDRARELLRELLPQVIEVIERQPQPAKAWARLDDLIYRLPAGVQIFSLVRHNPALLDRLGDVLGAAPSLADHLANVPSALEGLLAPHDIDPDPAASLAGQLADSRSLEEALQAASRMVRGEEFRLAVAELDGRVDADAAGLARSALAGAAIAALVPLVLGDHVRRFGRVRGGGIVVVALGRAGSREMMAGSDLDLLLVYDHPAEVSESDAARPMAASQYYARAAQAIVGALTVPTRDGRLFEVDMRLRPSGSQGPVAVSLRAFERYHREDAWTWERLALTRARVIAGPLRLRRRVESAIRRALRVTRPTDVRADTVAMRRRVLQEKPARGPWDVRSRDGGLLEVEFAVQALQLLHAQRPGVLHPETGQAIAAMLRAGVLTDADAVTLLAAHRAWRAIQGLLRIILGRQIPETLSAPLAARVARAAGWAGDPEGLESSLDDMAAQVRDVFTRLIGEIGKT